MAQPNNSDVGEGKGGSPLLAHEGVAQVAATGTRGIGNAGKRDGLQNLSTPAQKRQKRDPKPIDLEALKKMWSPVRHTRADEQTRKVRVVRDGVGIRGGDWVLNRAGGGATISFIFKYQGKYHGLTIGHLVQSVGDEVYFFADTKLHVPIGDEDEKKEGDDEAMIINEIKEDDIFPIGKVVSKSESTDSLVFELYPEVHVDKEHTVNVSNNSTEVLSLPEEVNHPVGPPPPLENSPLIGFGARSGGAYGVVDMPSVEITETTGQYVQRGNIRITGPDGLDIRLTWPGDCGAIFFDLLRKALYFHHCTTRSSPYKSYGFPLWDVMKTHDQLGGTSETNDTRKTEPEVLKDATGMETKPEQLAQFHTKIVESPQQVTQVDAALDATDEQEPDAAESGQHRLPQEEVGRRRGLIEAPG